MLCRGYRTMHWRPRPMTSCICWGRIAAARPRPWFSVPPTRVGVPHVECLREDIDVPALGGTRYLRCRFGRRSGARRSPHFSKPMFVFEQQQSGSEFKMLSEAILSSFIGLMEANKSQRVPASLSLERGFEVRRLGWVFRYICESRESGKSCRLGLRYESFARKHSGWISDRRHEIRWGGQEGRSFPGDCCARLS